jgi:hypothetical protein
LSCAEGEKRNSSEVPAEQCEDIGRKRPTSHREDCDQGGSNWSASLCVRLGIGGRRINKDTSREAC